MAMMMVLLQNCGMQLRSDDPAAMKVRPALGASAVGAMVACCLSRLLRPCGACLSPRGCTWRPRSRSISPSHLVSAHTAIICHEACTQELVLAVLRLTLPAALRLPLLTPELVWPAHWTLCWHWAVEADASSFKPQMSVTCITQEFVVAVHTRAAAARAGGGMTSRAEVMLGLVLDIKNNKRHRRVSGQQHVLAPEAHKWLKGAGLAAVQVPPLTWQRLLEGGEKVSLRLGCCCGHCGRC